MTERAADSAIRADSKETAAIWWESAALREAAFGNCFCMKNITLSADENLIEQARLIAKAQRRTLNAAFREWLEQFTGHSRSAQEFDSLMKRLRHVRAGRRFTRHEMNER